MIKKKLRKTRGFIQIFSVAVSLILLATPAVYATTWNLVNDFSTANISGSAWSFGYETTLGTGFTQYDSSIQTIFTNISGPVWYMSSYHAAGDYIPDVWKNTTTDYHWEVAPGEVSLHPGHYETAGALSVVRWSAPVSGEAAIEFTFGAGDLGTESYYVYVNGVQRYAWINDSYSESGTFTVNVTTGNTIDFIVGPKWGYDGTYGNTPLDAKISFTPTSVPEPASLLLFGLGLIGLTGLRRRMK